MTGVQETGLPQMVHEHAMQDQSGHTKFFLAYHIYIECMRSQHPQPHPQQALTFKSS